MSKQDSVTQPASPASRKITRALTKVLLKGKIPDLLSSEVFPKRKSKGGEQYIQFSEVSRKASHKITRDFTTPRNRGGGPGVSAKGLYPLVSRTKVAKLLGCDPSTVTGYLAGRTKMPLDKAIKFAKLAGIPVETLQRDLSRMQGEFGTK